MLARSSIRMGRDACRGGHLQRPAGHRGHAAGRSLPHRADSSRGRVTRRQPSRCGRRPRTRRRDHPELLLSLANMLARRQRLRRGGQARRAALDDSRLGSPPGCSSWGRTDSRSKTTLPPSDSLRSGLELDPEARRPPSSRRSIARSWHDACCSWAGPRRPTAGSSRCSRGSRRPPPIPRRTGWPAGPPSSNVSSIEPGRNWRNPATYRPRIRSSSSRLPTPARRSVPRVTRRSARPTSRHAMRGPSITRRTCSSSLARTGLSPIPITPTSSHTLVQDGKKLKVQTKVEDRMFETLVDYAFGTTDRYVSMVGRDGEGGYRAVRQSYFHEGKESGWGRTAGDAGNTDKTEHVRGQTIHVRDGVVRCLHCHVTNPREFRDRRQGRAGPRGRRHGHRLRALPRPGSEPYHRGRGRLPRPVDRQRRPRQGRVRHQTVPGVSHRRRCLRDGASPRGAHLGSISRSHDDLQPLLHRVRRRDELPDLP